jgi:hypothetical protein
VNKGLKFAVIFTLVMAVLMGAVFLFTSNNDKDDGKNKDILETPDDPIYDPTPAPDVTPVDYMMEKKDVKIYLPNESLDGYSEQVVQYKYNGNETNLYKVVVEDILFNRLPELGLVAVPEGAEVLDIKVWNETLNISFSKEILESDVEDKVKEQYVLGSLVKTLLGSSEDFTDIQLLVEGERIETIFGHLNTWNPITA